MGVLSDRTEFLKMNLLDIQLKVKYVILLYFKVLRKVCTMSIYYTSCYKVYQSDVNIRKLVTVDTYEIHCS